MSPSQIKKKDTIFEPLTFLGSPTSRIDTNMYNTLLDAQLNSEHNDMCSIIFMKQELKVMQLSTFVILYIVTHSYTHTHTHAHTLTYSLTHI